ncbi:MAG TPA: M6 family metalloprotease domain-containing protein, partial [Firmicutes bacterium]|nr:M6 family metalloprotease domain-containing protein [Bacillota bacterium]
MSARYPRLIVVSILLALSVSSLSAMPPRPDLLERLREEPEMDLPLERSQLGAGRFLEKVELELPDTIICLVLLADFDDANADTLSHSVDHFQHILFDCSNARSLRNYYLWNSYGKLDITGEVRGWFRLPQPLSFYADNRKGVGYYPRNAQKMIEDAIVIADPYVDFSRFDNDGPDGIPSSGDDDGFVDFLLVVHGGSGYEWTLNPADIHSHAGTIEPLEADGVKIRTYATEPEDGNVGTFAHELGHLLGLPDLYDPTLSSFGLGMWSLMAYGSWGGGDGSEPVGLDAWSKVRLGFIEPVVLDTNITNYHLPSVENSPIVLKLWSEGAQGSQYFLVENRQAVGWDSYLSNFGEGLLIYHVDERFSDNSSPAGHLVSLEQADGRFDLEKRRSFGFGSDNGDPYPGETNNRAFAWWTVPNNYSNEGSPTQVTIVNIGDPDEVMTFDVGVWTPIVLLEDYVVDDARGDGDGRPEPGEDVDVLVRLHNHGFACENLEMVLSSGDPRIVMGESRAFLDRIEKGEVSRPLRFSLEIGSDVLEPYRVDLGLSIEGQYQFGTYRYLEDFTFAVPLHLVEPYPIQTDAGIIASLVGSDLDGDGLDEIIACTQAGTIYVWKVDGSSLPGWPVSLEHPIQSKPAVCDIDVDGSREIIVATVSGLLYVLRSDGSVASGWPKQMRFPTYSSPVLAELDDEGLGEVICATIGGEIYVWNEDGE